jgi:ABC-type Mn2+/Zn2+ transport system permease subunit
VLSVGLLVLPAATVYLLSDSYRALTWYGGFLGAAGACAGLLLSYWADIPSGPAIVLVLGACFVAALVFGPRYGVLARLRPSRHLHRQSLARWQKQPAGAEKAGAVP